MEYNPAVGDMRAGMTVEGFYILKEAAVKSTQAGRPFLSGTLEDRTGTVEIKSWDYSGPVTAADAGRVVKIRGDVSDYRGAPQVTVYKIRLANGADVYRAEDLVPAAPIDREAAMAEVRTIVSSIADDDYRAVAQAMLDKDGEAFSRVPAAKSVHHGFLGGLLMHTLWMLRTADFLAGLYPSVIDRSLLLAGTLLHDFAKTEEFAFSDLGLVTEYTVPGKLIGHLVTGAENVRREAQRLGLPEEKIMLLCHLILSHHGEPEFGAAVIPRCAEAELLYHIDLIDSRMEICREALAGAQPGTFTPKIYALDKDLYRRKDE